MSVYGVDTCNSVTNVVNALYGNGYKFVARYYSASAWKRITGTESAAIYSAQMKRVSVYQNSHNSYSCFDFNTATTDAGDAISQARGVGQPISTAIYFPVDYDASAAEVDGNISIYFQRVKSLLNAAGYTLGVYGSTLVCKKLKNSGVVNYTWLTMASGWGFGETFSNWNIKQLSGITISGVQFDKDEAVSLTSIGAW